MTKIIAIIVIIAMIAYFTGSCSSTKTDEATQATEVSTVVADTESLIFETAEEYATEPTETKEVIELVPEVPKYNQLEYTQRYGSGTVRSGGCGITCLSMVATYLLDDPTLTPDVLAAQFGRYYTVGGSSWTLFTDSAEILGLGEVKQVFNWPDGIEEALSNGQLVISNQRGGLFTSGGHYILLVGLTEEGKVMVHDPNGENWEKVYMIDGFENGFPVEAVSCHSAAYWIYPRKDAIHGSYEK